MARVTKKAFSRTLWFHYYNPVLSVQLMADVCSCVCVSSELWKKGNRLCIMSALTNVRSLSISQSIESGLLIIVFTCCKWGEIFLIVLRSWRSVFCYFCCCCLCSILLLKTSITLLKEANKKKQTWLCMLLLSKISVKTFRTFTDCDLWVAVSA